MFLESDWRSPMIACIHVPRFAVEAERLRHPDIASRLILIGDARVLDCSLGAEASGVRPGLRLSEAIGLCHKAVVLPPDSRYYERLYEQVLDYLQQLSPEVEPMPLGAFQAQFGPDGKRCWELAQGLDKEPLVPRIQEETVLRRFQLAAPAVTLEAIMAAVERLVHAAYQHPQRGGSWVRKA